MSPGESLGSGAFAGTVPWRRTDGPLFEYACHEGNDGVTNLLASARAVEAAEAVAAGRSGR